MDVRFVWDPREFLTAVTGFLAAEPFSANVVAVEVEGIVDGRRILRPGSRWIVVEDDGDVVGAAMHTPPYDLFLPRLRPGAPEAVARELRRVGVDLPGASGEIGTVRSFCREWRRLGGAASERRVAMRMYVLGTLRPPSVTGSARRAVLEDAPLLGGWLRAFADETKEVPRDVDLDDVIRRRTADGQVWLWEVGGEPVALAAVSPPASGVARVGPVYTPPDRRRGGFGSAVTAAASQAALDAGAAHVGLYTDLDNPTSNAIYRAIGYEPDHDAEHRSFFDR